MDHPDTLLHSFTSITEPLRLEELFLKPLPMQLEIGCGDGGFLLGHAEAHPDRNFIGVERLLGRIRKLDKKGRRAGLQNLRLLRIEARYLIEHLLPKNHFETLHVYFPDPWPKDKHARHRLINEAFPSHAARLLQPGGIIHLRTDSVPYFEQMQTVFPAHGAFKEEPTPAALKARVTEFESEFNAQGIPTNHASWRLATS
jgi:tRNA (guanine-N7-)-methyltransferase